MCFFGIIAASLSKMVEAIVTVCQENLTKN